MKTILEKIGPALKAFFAAMFILLAAIACEKEIEAPKEEDPQNESELQKDDESQKEDDAVSENTLEVEFTEVEIDAQGEQIQVPLTTNAPLAEPSVTHDWLTAQVSDDHKKLLISAGPNKSGKARTGHVSLSTAAEEGEQAKVSVKVTQSTLDAATLFHFAQENYSLNQPAGEIQVSIISSGNWQLSETEKIPGWLKISPTSGTGDASITVEYTVNIMQDERKANLMFTNTDLNHTAILNLTQAQDPTGLKDFSHLGEGYDASGQYAYDSDTRARVLDPKLLFEADAIAQPDKLYQTEEECITGKSRSEFMTKYSASAGLSGNVSGFTGSINTTFSKEALETSENSFCTFRHLTKKQVIKLHTNLKASDLIPYLDKTFSEDIKTMSGTDIVSKYGTHVILGLAIGGVLEYSMAADLSETNLSTSLDVAAKAGFENLTFGVSGSAGYNDLNTIKTNDSSMEHRLICRGGESQFASNGINNSQSTYDLWLKSLEDSQKWVMVDYEGSMLVGIEEFITDLSKANEVKQAATAHLSKKMLPGQTPKWGRLYLEPLATVGEFKNQGTIISMIPSLAYKIKDKLNNTEKEYQQHKWEPEHIQKNSNVTLTDGQLYQTLDNHKVNTRMENNYTVSCFGELNVGGIVGGPKNFDLRTNLKFNRETNRWVDINTNQSYKDGDIIEQRFNCKFNYQVPAFSDASGETTIIFKYKVHWDRKVN